VKILSNWWKMDYWIWTIGRIILPGERRNAV